MAEGTVAGGPVSDDRDEGFQPQPVEALPDVPGAVSTRPDVLEARARVVAARDELVRDVDQLATTTRSTFDIKARIRGIPDRVRQDPARAAAAAAVVVGTVGGIVVLVVRSRRRKPYGYLPADIEEALSRLGKNGDKLRRSLEDSFAAYLREHGAQEPSKRRRVPPALVMFAAPIASQLTRAALKRMMAAPDDAEQ